MMDKFLNEYDKFRNHKILEDLTESTKVTLFGVFCEAMGRKAQKSAPQSTPQRSQPQNEYDSNGVTPKQRGLIKSLQSKGFIDEDIDLNEYNKRSASRLISSGIKKQEAAKAAKNKPKPAPAPTPEPPAQVVPAEDEEFTGAYSHVSNGHESQGHFWE